MERVLTHRAVRHLEVSRAEGHQVPGMGHHHDRQGLLGVDAPEDLHDLGLGLLVQVAAGLVGEQEVRPIDERAGDDHALLLPSRKLAGERFGAMAEADSVEQFARPRPGIGVLLVTELQRQE